MIKELKKPKTLAALLKAAGLTEEHLSGVKSLYEKMAKKMALAKRAAFVARKMCEYKLEACIAEINGGWEENWADTSQYKWYMWWWFEKNKKGSGVSLSLGSVDFDFSYASVAPRRCFETEAKCRGAAKILKPLYEELYLGSKRNKR